MNNQILTSLISAISIITGSLLGAFSTYIISDKMYKKECLDNDKKEKISRLYHSRIRNKIICDNVCQIRLDIANSIYQSIRNIRNNTNSNTKNISYLIPISKNYGSIIASLNHLFSLKELSDIYQLYAIIDKVSISMKSDKLNDNDLLSGFISILYKIYGNNYNKIIQLDPDTVEYNKLISTNYVTHSFNSIFYKIEKYCKLDNL